MTGRRAWSSTPRRQQLRAAVFAQHGTTCWLCGRPGATTVDHLIPRAHGGPDTTANLRPAHATCNTQRGTRPPPQPAPSRTY